MLFNIYKGQYKEKDEYILFILFSTCSSIVDYTTIWNLTTLIED